MTPNSRDVERHLVWVCCGCEECDPTDGGPRSSTPCDGPSMNGMEVVAASDFDALRAEVERLQIALWAAESIMDELAEAR